MSGPRTAAAVLAFVVVGAGCTRAQMEAFVAWHEVDPAGAEQWAQSPEAAQFMDDVPTAAPASRTSSQRDAGVWERIAWCESGGNWSMRATNSTGTYGGGLAIRDNVWRAYGGGEFAANAGLATKTEQIVVAERIRADVGLGAWDCA